MVLRRDTVLFFHLLLQKKIRCYYIALCSSEADKNTVEKNFSIRLRKSAAN